jgi:transcriptional regulator
MTVRQLADRDPQWFCALLDTASEVYFRYALLPTRRFEYLSPSVSGLTGRSPEDFYADAALCVGLIAREDRRVLRQLLRARRGLTTTIRILRHNALVPVELKTVTVIRNKQVVAIEGTARLSASAPRSNESATEPMQQRLASLMYEVHDLLHKVLPPSTAASSSPNVITLGNLQLDLDRLTVTEAGRPIQLTSRETLVLRYLLQHRNRIVTRQQLLTDVWNYNYAGDDRTVDVHISRLRRKLPSLKAHLVAIKHVGYRLDELPAA